jgi:hypothetical protein
MARYSVTLPDLVADPGLLVRCMTHWRPQGRALYRPLAVFRKVFLSSHVAARSVKSLIASHADKISHTGRRKRDISKHD